jgi:hypothetical protein
MFTNIFGKGYLKFANFFFKNSVIQINKDANIININSNKSSEETKIFHNGENVLDISLLKKSSIDLETPLKELTETKTFVPINKKYDPFVLKRLEEEAYKESSGLTENRLKNRVCEWHISANDPREDRSNSIQLKNLDGYYISVIDGHGGDFIAKYTKKELHKIIDQKLLDLKFSGKMEEILKEKLIREAINFAFDALVSIIFIYK